MVLDIELMGLLGGHTCSISLAVDAIQHAPTTEGSEITWKRSL